MSAVAFNLYNPKDTCCVVVGLGLIGRSIQQYINLFGQQVNATKIQFSWASSSEIIDAIIHLYVESKREKLALIWSAGRGGFAADDNEMKKEYDIFSEVISSLAKKHGDNLSINMLSSAGGIYEGNDNIANISDVAPIRPYGIWKLKQETLIESLNVPARFYRISSAYGYINASSRLGLINNLINATFANKNALIYASPYTLRDYIFTQDIARFVVENVVGDGELGPKILASGRSVSVNMLISLIAQLLRKRVKVSYSPTNANSRDIVFQSRLLPECLSITSMEESIRMITTNSYFSH